MKVLNIYKRNIYQELTFMFKIKWYNAPSAFRNDFQEKSNLRVLNKLLNQDQKKT